MSMLSISLLATAVIVAPLGALLSLGRSKALAITLVGVTIFTHALAWVWAMKTVGSEGGDPFIVAPFGLVAEGAVFFLAIAIAEEIDS